MAVAHAMPPFVTESRAAHRVILLLLGCTLLGGPAAWSAQAACVRLEPLSGAADLGRRFTGDQVGILEKLNRRDHAHLARLDTVVVPCDWSRPELELSPMPHWYEWATRARKALVVQIEWQVFGAFENGRLVRWGPVSSGRHSRPTPQGFFHLNWRSPGRRSSIDPRWYMRWYFNFESQQGLSFHEFALPGRPASHACIRLLSRDAQWLYRWGESWKLDDQGVVALEEGTPVLIVGAYEFDRAPPWRSADRVERGVVLPVTPLRAD